MIRKLGLSLLCATAMWSSHVCANTIMLGLGLNYPVDLPFNQPVELHNFTNSTIYAKCTVNKGSPVNEVQVKMNAYTATFNGHDLLENDRITQYITTPSDIIIQANPGAKVELTNTTESKLPILSTCVLINKPVPISSGLRD